MTFAQFMLSQMLLMISFWFSLAIAGHMPGTAGYLILNFLAFFPATFVLTHWFHRAGHIYAHLLSVTLSFNLVTYLWASAAAGIAIPGWQELAADFALVAGYTVAATYLGLHWPSHRG